MKQTSHCWGCNVDLDGHHCMEVDPAVNYGKLDCVIDKDQEGKERCHFAGESCGPTAFFLPANEVTYFAASGSFAIAELGNEPVFDSTGYVRLCTGEVIDRADTDGGESLTFSL